MEWPKNEHDMKLQIPAFRDWYNSTDGVRFLDKLYTDSYIDHWRGLDIKNFLIYNMHEDPKLLKTFYCSTLGLNYTCKKHNETTDEKQSNKGFSLANDRLACTLYFRGYINTTKTKQITRFEAGEIIENLFIRMLSMD